ncbi:PAS domain-containing hybrid sensor histidine kinase/response regulator [Aminicella lysinilytica]|mgnify:CR=1 FL=1|uniref:PAS domain-containing hybrid sensor histidine kinase/response regulator n=1 Tax=Aminicella lysinilytica TaxID=433323 RepID=UPI0026F083A4|nr:PAS domain-containing sensor histidine kinase [Aminicella lysinilytica]
MATDNISFGEIRNFIDMAPGNYIVHYVDGKKLRPLYYSSTLPGIFGMSKDTFANIITEDLLNSILSSERDYVFSTVFDQPVGTSNIESEFRANIRNEILWVHSISKVIGTYKEKPLILSNCISSSTEARFSNGVLDNTESRIYIVDRASLELLYISNTALEHLAIHHDNPSAPRKCYQVLHGYDKPCKSCHILHNDVPRPDGIEKYYADIDQWTSTRAVQLPWCGHDAEVIFIDDITATKKIQLAILENQQAMNSLIKSAPGGFIVCSADNDHDISFTSENTLSMLGYTPDQFNTKFHNRFSNMIYYEDRQAILDDITAQTRKRNYCTNEFRIERSDGSLMWVHCESHSTTDVDGRRNLFIVIVDVTSTINHSSEMSAHTAELEQIVQNIPAGIIVFRKSGNKITVETANDYIGVIVRDDTRAIRNTTYEGLEKYIHPGDVIAVRKEINKLFSDEHRASFSFRSPDHNSKEYFWLNMSAYSVDQPDGTQMAYAIITDATEQKEKERLYNQTISDYFRSSPDSLCSYRLNLTRNKFIGGQSQAAFNDSLMEATSVPDFYDRFIGGLILDADISAFQTILSSDHMITLFKDGKTSYSLEFHYSDGQDLRWANFFLNLLQNPTTRDIEAIIFIKDINESVKTRKVMNYVSKAECVFVAVIDVNKGTRSFYSDKYGPADAVYPTAPMEYRQSIIAFQQDGHDKDLDLLYEDIALPRVIEQLTKDDVYTVPFVKIAFSGEEFHEQLNFSYLDDTKTEIIETSVDVTETFRQQRKQLEELNNALDAAAKANASKSDFLSRVSHDIRTPMNVISGMTKFALEDIDDKAKLTDDLEKIKIANTFLLSLISDILDLSKIESGRVTIKPQLYTYADFISNVRGMIVPLCEDKDLKFTIHEHHGPFQAVMIDKVRMNQIVLNLLSNAVKYTPAGGSVDFYAGTSVEDDGQAVVCFTVSDTGIGMSKEFQTEMFEPFTQNRDNYTDVMSEEQGTGLGLAIVDKLTELMNGKISVDSELGKGTSITVTLNADIVTSDPETVSTGVDNGISDTSGLGKCLLLVEDNYLNAEIAKRLLVEKGYEVVTVENGKEAVNAFIESPEGKFAAVLMDLRMPVMNGMDATKEIRAMERADAKSVPIIAMTANAYHEDILKCLEAGMNAHVSKPIEPDDLFRILNANITG